MKNLRLQICYKNFWQNPKRKNQQVQEYYRNSFENLVPKNKSEITSTGWFLTLMKNFLFGF